LNHTADGGLSLIFSRKCSMRISAAADGLECPRPTARRLRHSLSCWLRHAADHDLCSVSAAEFDRFRYSAMAAGLSPVTIESVVSDVVYIARRHGIRPLVGRRLRRPVSQLIVPSLGTIGRLYTVADHATWPRRDWCSPGDWWRSLLVVGFWTALRRGDLARLAWVHIEDDRIDLDASKTGWRH